MPGLTANIINLITDNLRDRYQSGFPILKELIQNADDAEAQRFVFGYHAGFPHANNPLLHGPGLLCYNNGKFKKSDKKAIASFAENTKAAEEGTIGKFGLGMKSIFHLCEAFLYVANDGTEIHREILNPWNISDDNIHPHWENVSDFEWNELENAAREISGEDITWFFLWIPLRQQRHLVTENGEKTGSIMERFPGDEGFDGPDLSFLRDSSLRSRLASILPLLPNLSSITLLPSATSRINFTLMLESDGRLERKSSVASSTGKVHDAVDKFSLHFHGNKIEVLDSSVLAKLKQHHKWPKTYYRDERGHLCPAEDKSRPEGSILICRQEQGNGKLSIQWALFLPLEEESHLFEASNVNSQTDYKIYIHGQFFVDAGRRGIFAFSQIREDSKVDIESLDETGLRRCWNNELARQISLPLFIPTLEKFIRTNSLCESDIYALTDAINKSSSKDNSSKSFLGMFKQSICANHSWCRIVEREAQVWRKIDHRKAHRLLLLPAPPKGEPSRPWTVLPMLDSMGDAVSFVDVEAPSISLRVEQWSENELAMVLGGDTFKAFSSSTQLDYLASFLEKAAGPYLGTERPQKALLALIREGFRNTPIAAMRQHRQRVVNVVRFLLPQYRLSIGPQDASARTAVPENIISALWRCDADVIILPKDLDDNEKPGEAKPQRADVLLWLRTIHDMIDSPLIQNVALDRCLDVTSELLRKQDENQRSGILRTNPDLRIIQAIDARTLQVAAVSYATLENALKRNNLFGFALGNSAVSSAGLTRWLADAVPQEQILLIKNDTFKTLFINSETLPSSNDGMAILMSLGATQKKLGPAHARRKLIEHVDNPGQDKSAILGLRYLLHGHEAHYADDNTTLWVARHQQSPAWEKLWRLVSRIESNDAWNILGRGLVENLPSARWESLGIKEIESSAVIAELEKIGTNDISQEPFTDTECEEILASIEDRHLWTTLPFHVLKGGGRCRVDNSAYLDTGKALPIGLASSIQIIAKSNNSVIVKKQKDWITPLDESSIIRIALESRNPGSFWRLIVEMLENYHSPLREESSRIMRETAWLPLRSGGIIRPADVINIQVLSQDVQILASKADYCYADVADLGEDILKSTALEYLKKTCFASSDAALERLGLLMAEIDSYKVGQIDLSVDSGLIKAMPALSKVEAMPSWSIVNRALKEFGEEKCLSILLPAIAKPVSTDMLVSALQQLASECSHINEAAEDAFKLYLRLFCNDQPEAKFNLSRLTLRTKTGKWKSAGELCTGVTDVDDEYVLEQSLAEILSDVAVDAGQFNAAGGRKIGPVDIGRAIQAAPRIIEDYFNKWNGLVREELIGALLCLLGPRLRELAKHFLGKHSYDWVVSPSQIGWKSAERVDSDGNRTWVRDYVPAKILDSLEVAFRIVDEDSVAVLNLMGYELKVHLAREFSTIIAGAPEWDGDRRVYLPLRNIKPDNFTSEELSSLLKETIRYILDKCYYQPRAVLDGLWQEIDQTDQLQIDVVRGMILDHLPYSLRQLNAHNKSEPLRKVLENYDQARERYQENKNSSQSSSGRLDLLSKELDNKKECIAKILQDNEEAKKAVLEAVKQKLKDYQYDVQSLPFELFQNADDAAIELGFFDPDDDGGPQIPVSSQKLVVDIEGAIIRFMHWGRMINATGRTVKGRERGYHRDLEKMLILSSSDKPIGEGVTGKFGLGFKSVFLCCDRPCILSGVLRVEIAGGVLPQPWTPSLSTVARLAHFSEDRRYQGTLIELQLNEEVLADKILVRFRRLVGLLSVFGRAIRRIVVASPNCEKTISWNPGELFEGIEIGKCEAPEGSETVSMFGIVFRIKSGVIFFALNPSGFTALSKEVPSVWVTAPTREDESLGFAVSAAFSLDAGRGRLAGESEENIRLAEKIGRELGVKIAYLVDQFETDWPSARQKLHLADSISVAGFIASIWRTLLIAANSKDGTKICFSLAMQALTKFSNGPIPNGLPFPYEQMVGDDSIRHELSGPWGQREVIEQLIGVGVPVECCIASDIAILLRRLDLGRSIRKLDFSTLIQQIDGQCCEDNNARTLEAIANLVWDQLKEEEKKQATDELATLLFKNASGEWTVSRVLLCAGIGDKEEELRVRFAPESARLSDIYDEAGRAFFRRCRPRYDAPTEILADWVCDANSEVKQQAALQYLVNGDLGFKVARYIRENGLTGTWLDAIGESHEYLKSWNESDKDELLRRLVVKVNFVPIQQPQPPHDPKKALNAIYDWWQLNKQQQIMLYERRAFPSGCFPSLKHDFLKNEPEARKGWLTLFLLGACHTIGRSKPEQHRSFIELCHSKGWMDRFVTVNKDGLDEWMTVIKNYLQDEIQDPEYFHWMKEFVSIFLFGYWLDEYVHSFMAIDRIQRPFSLKHITSPRINPDFQGGGPDAPPIDRALGMGACFVIRELTRKKIINNQLAYQFCYVPRRPVREFLERLGCSGLNSCTDYETRSKMIYEFLCEHLGKEKAKFDNAFDLPLLIVAMDPHLQVDLLKTTVVTDSEAEEEIEYVQ
ncbi:hypothetical protein BAC1_00305 [uncultured bacterium]|nr:hypothetical protein BAC1_00305 [uncultured bacterium]